MLPLLFVQAKNRELIARQARRVERVQQPGRDRPGQFRTILEILPRNTKRAGKDILDRREFSLRSLLDEFPIFAVNLISTKTLFRANNVFLNQNTLLF